MIFHLQKEHCSYCLGSVNVGHPFLECFRCDVIVHGKCFEKSECEIIDSNFYCKNCKTYTAKSYNPFLKLIENEEEPDPYLCQLSNILNNCKSYSTKDFRDSLLPTLDGTGLLFMNIDGNKTNFDSFIVELDNIKNPFSFIGLAETNTNPDESNVFNMPGYNRFYQDTAENKQKGTGTAIYVKSSFNAVVNNIASRVTDNLETLFVTVQCESEPVNIGVVYRPPSGCNTTALSELLELLETLPKTPVHIMGDFNINMLDHGKSNIVSKLEEITLGLGYSPLISKATHAKPGCSESCIDNIFTNSIENTKSSGIIEFGVSHHHALFQFVEIPSSLTNDTKENNKHLQFFDYCNSNLDHFSESLRCKLTAQPPSSFQEFFALYNTQLDLSCKLEKPRNSKRTMKNNPWMTPALIASVKTKATLYSKWKKSKNKKCIVGIKSISERKLCTCTKCSTILLTYEKYRTHRKILKHLIRQVKSKYYGQQIENCNGDSKKVWRIINELRGKQKREIKPSFIVDSKRVTDRRMIANEFNNYFVSLAAKLNEKYTSTTLQGLPIVPIQSFHDYLPKSNQSSIFMYECTHEEVSKIITELKKGKSSDIPINVVKYSAPVVIPYLVNLFNTSLHKGLFPDELKTGRITPIYKKDNEELMENYRPVSTLPVFGKILEKIIYSRFYNFLLSNRIIHDCQFGFRKGHSTTHALNYSIQHIENELDKKKHVIGIFIDLSKAFDTIDHNKLLCKLEHYGIRGNALDLIKSYLCNRKQYVSVLNETSEAQTVVWGVPQGSVLGPLLFLLYINDLCNTTQKCRFVLFADDTNIFISADTKETAYMNANEILSSVTKYMKCNLLHINAKKSCFMYFSPFKRKTTMSNLDEPTDLINPIQIEGNILKRVSQTKFLGVIIDNKLNWKPHIDSLNRNLKSACGRIYRIKSNIPKNLYKEIYHTLFESHLSYSISVWGGVSKSRLLPIFLTQKKCTRIIFGDTEAYLDKFRTCARARPFESQILGKEFYMKEPSKPLFNTNKILSVHNLYKYRTIMEVYKILKYHLPISIYSLFNRSTRKEGLLITSTVLNNFVSRSSRMWNMFGQSGGRVDLNLSDCAMKKCIKSMLLELETYSETWCDSNFDGFGKSKNQLCLL